MLAINYYAWNKRKHDTAQHSCVRHLGNALDKRDWRWHLSSAFSQRLRKYTFTAVHTKTHKRRFQIYPLWRAFSNLCIYRERFHRLREDGRPKRIKKSLRLLAFAFTIVFVWTGPQTRPWKFSARLLNFRSRFSDRWSRPFVEGVDRPNMTHKLVIVWYVTL